MNDIAIAPHRPASSSHLPSRPSPRFIPVITGVRTLAGVSIPHGGTTSETSLSFVGVAQANGKVRIFDGPDELAIVNANATGHWSAVVNNLDVTTHAFAAATSDGQHSLLWIVHVKKASAPMIVEVVDSRGQIIENGGVTDDRSLRFSGTADLHNEVVELFDGGALKAVTRLNENGDWHVQLDEVEDGLHEYQVMTSDGQSSPIWTVIVEASQGTLIEYIQDSKGVVPNHGITTDTSLSFVGSARANQRLKLFDRSELRATVNVDANRHWSARLDGLNSGTHEFLAVSDDGKGSAPWVVTVMPEITPKILLVKDSMGHPIGNGGSTTGTSVTLEGRATSGAAGQLVDYSGTLEEFVTNASGAWSVQVKDLAVAFHTFRVVMGSGLTSEPWVVRVIEPVK